MIHYILKSWFFSSICVEIGKTIFLHVILHIIDAEICGFFCPGIVYKLKLNFRHFQPPHFTGRKKTSDFLIDWVSLNKIISFIKNITISSVRKSKKRVCLKFQAAFSIRKGQSTNRLGQLCLVHLNVYILVFTDFSFNCKCTFDNLF